MGQARTLRRGGQRGVVLSAALPILYGNREAGHSYKVRQTLVLLGMAHEYRYVDLLPPRAERRADFVAVSPYGEVPVSSTKAVRWPSRTPYCCTLSERAAGSVVAATSSEPRSGFSGRPIASASRWPISASPCALPTRILAPSLC